jgi:hypothetical protein
MKHKIVLFQKIEVWISGLSARSANVTINLLKKSNETQKLKIYHVKL